MHLPHAVRWSAYICFGRAVLLGISSVVILAFGQRFIASEPSGRAGGMAALLVLVMMALALCVGPLLVLAYTFCGIGLLRRWRWMRGTTIVVAAIDGVLTVPVGTVLSAILIFLLLKPESKAAFEAPAPAAYPMYQQPE